MKPHNFKIVGGDTDSIMFCKPDMSPFPEEEQEALLAEINSMLPKEIKFANDGIFARVVYLKAKNYVMEDLKGKRKIKGSALKSSTLEPILKQMLNEFIDAIIEDKLTKLPDLYMKYVHMVPCITDVKPWCTKKTLSATTFASQRKNESTIVDAIQGSEYVEGDKVWLFRATETTWKLAEQFDGVYSWDKYFEKVFKTAQRFSTVMDTKSLFPNYSLLKPQKELLDKLGLKNPERVEKVKKPRKKKDETSSPAA